MSEPLRVLTSPVRAIGGLRLAQLITLVTADAAVRALRADDRSVEWTAGVLTGDLSSQLAVEQELAREGLDRAAAGREEFVARVRTTEADGRAHAAELLTALGIAVDLDAGALDGDDVALAARTAFVRLYEAGQLVREERVVNACPRCATVVDDVDAEAGTATASCYQLHVTTADGVPVDVATIAVELLPGVAAVAVPDDHPAAGGVVELPVAGRAVPLIADGERDAPAMVIPAHDPHDLETARRYGLSPITVLDLEGTVVAPGPLEGLGRYAARAAAADLLSGEGVIEATAEVDEAVARCRRCGTVVVPRLGRHWFLPMADLEVLAADAVRQGAIVVTPGSAGDDLVARAGQRGDWCVSQQVWAGQPVPVATCADCGQVAVGVELAGSCGKCMGVLVADDDVFDARFVGAVWPLAVAGWPRDEAGPGAAAPSTLLLIAPTGLILWAVRMAALGFRLAGASPFARVAVHPPVDLLLYLESVGDGPDTDIDAVRAALLAGGLDVEWAADIAASLAPAVLTD